MQSDVWGQNDGNGNRGGGSDYAGWKSGIIFLQQYTYQTIYKYLRTSVDIFFVSTTVTICHNQSIKSVSGSLFHHRIATNLRSVAHRKNTFVIQ